MAYDILFVNGTLKDHETSNTRALMEDVADEFDRYSIPITSHVMRLANFTIPRGVSQREAPDDDFPAILDRLEQADILIMGSPIWNGKRSSHVHALMERLNATYTMYDEDGQFPLYNTVGGVVITGNEDGAKQVAQTTLYDLHSFGCVIPPNANIYWVGEAGPGPSYMKAGQDHTYTQNLIRFFVPNALHMARLLDEHPIPTDLERLRQDD